MKKKLGHHNKPGEIKQAVETVQKPDPDLNHVVLCNERKPVGYLEQTLDKQASVVFEGRVSLAQARALPLRQGEEEAERAHDLQGMN